jgi:hypothetical protein
MYICKFKINNLAKISEVLEFEYECDIGKYVSCLQLTSGIMSESSSQESSTGHDFAFVCKHKQV